MTKMKGGSNCHKSHDRHVFKLNNPVGLYMKARAASLNLLMVLDTALVEPMA